MTERPLGRRALLTAVGGVVLAGCLDDGSEVGAYDGAGDDGREGQAGDDATATPDAAGDDHDAPFPVVEPTVPVHHELEEYLDEIRSGGVSEDGIPAIDDPKSMSADEADDLLDPGDPVFGVERNGEARAYPQRILVWHEIANDELGGDPIAVTYCPLTGTAQGFERGDTTFGVSGQLLNSNVVLFDRETESWWSQVLRVGIDGPLAGYELSEFRVVWTTWERWKELYPETTVLSDDTGHARNYRSDPYGSYNPVGGYYEQERVIFWTMHHGDDRLRTKDVVIGARSEDGAIAVEKDYLREKSIIDAETDAGVPHVVVYDPTLDTGYVYRNPDELAVDADGDGYAVDGDGPHEPKALPLDRVLAVDAMWFAWYAFYPDSTLVKDDE